MKKAVSISIGSSKRDKAVEIDLLGKTVSLERIGTDGDLAKAAQLYREMDGHVDAFGVGGTDLGLLVDGKWYPLHSVQPLVAGVRKTPVVDGTGLKTTLERRVAPLLEQITTPDGGPKRALIVAGVDRWGLGQAFVNAGYQCLFGDLMFALGLPFPIRSSAALKRVARIMIPIASRLPFHWVYPVGHSQEKRTPRWGEHFAWANVIAGDCHYIRRYMPNRLDGKTIVTNTTTPADIALFKQTGVRYLITTTPVLDGRSFGTNMLEAGLAAACERTKPVDYAHPGAYFDELDAILDQINLKPQLQEL